MGNPTNWPRSGWILALPVAVAELAFASTLRAIQPGFYFREWSPKNTYGPAGPGAALRSATQFGFSSAWRGASIAQIAARVSSLRLQVSRLFVRRRPPSGKRPRLYSAMPVLPLQNSVTVWGSMRISTPDEDRQQQIHLAAKASSLRDFFLTRTAS